jgi:C-terminal processing protease CtpA/Prc
MIYQLLAFFLITSFLYLFLRLNIKRRQNETPHLLVYKSKTLAVKHVLRPEKLSSNNEILLSKLGVSIVMYNEKIPFIVKLDSNGPLARAGAKLYDTISIICRLPLEDGDTARGIISNLSHLKKIHCSLKQDDQLLIAIVRNFDRKNEKIIELTLSL